MKKVKQLFFAVPELLLIALTAFYWVSSGTFVNPIAIGLIVLLLIQFFLRNDYLGVVIPILIVLASSYLMLALFSEIGEFQVWDSGARRLLIIGFLFLLATIASSVLMIRKYTKAK